MLTYDFEESIGYWLILASQAYRRVLSDELAPHGITFRQAQVLGWLVHSGELSQAELAERMEIEPPTLAGVIDRMERDQLISRRQCPDDRRKKLVNISTQAGPMWTKITAAGRRVRALAATGLTADEASELRRLLAIVHGNLSTPTGAGLLLQAGKAARDSL